ncbi:MAG: patatin-like phospholipase family protein [Hyphomicrobiaceae bacterium]
MRNPIPNAIAANRATLPNMSGVRAWADEVPTDFASEIRRRLPSMPRLAQSSSRIHGRPLVEILALSGGGGDGAFGAGFLAGWTARGDRPSFEVVTGVSAGAIIAPFAFLGPRYDRTLREIWTQYTTNQIITAQVLPGLIAGSALADTAPLAQLIAKYVNARLLREIAHEYRRGRILMVGTTNIDAQRPVVWNMGEIAASGHPDSLELFRKVILASAAIPGAFPPVGIQVQVDGKRYEEMHVDGGTTREVFISPVKAPLKTFDALYDAPPIRRIYLIKNGKLSPEYEPVPKQTIPLSVRAIFTLIKSQSQSEIAQIWRTAKDGGADFNLVSVPPTFTKKPNEAFDSNYQSALYEVGYTMGRSGRAWVKRPPGIRNGRVVH